MDAIWGHGVLPTPEYNEWSELCKGGNDVHANCSWLPWAYWYQFVGDDDVDPYSLSAPICSNEESSGAPSATEATASKLGSFPATSDKRREVAVTGLRAQRQRLLDSMPARQKYPNGFPQHSLMPRAEDDGNGRQKSKDSSTAAAERRAARATMTRDRLSSETTSAVVSSPHPRALQESNDVYEPCWEALETQYLNRPDVRAALHVDHNRPWASCDDPVFYHYDPASQARPMEAYYLKLIRDYNYEVLGMPPLKLLVFSGDDDAICGTHGTMSWIFALGLKVASYWQPWFFDDAIYGNRLAG